MCIRDSRRMTIMTSTFVPCGAKLPVIALVAGAIMGGAWWMAPSMYFIGIASVIVSCIILKKTKMFAGDPSPFVIELPQYHVPVSYTHLDVYKRQGLCGYRAGGDRGRHGRGDS